MGKKQPHTATRSASAILFGTGPSGDERLFLMLRGVTLPAPLFFRSRSSASPAVCTMSVLFSSSSTEGDFFALPMRVAPIVFRPE